MSTSTAPATMPVTYFDICRDCGYTFLRDTLDELVHAVTVHRAVLHGTDDAALGLIRGGAA